MRRYWIYLVTTTVLIVGTFIATLASGNSPVLGLDLQGGVSVVKSPVGKFNDKSLDVAVELIRARVDSLGTFEPEITRQGSDIVIDLPGVKDRDRAIRLVGKTGELRFRPVLLNPGQVPPRPGSEPAADSTTTTTPPTTGVGETTTTTTTTLPPTAESEAAAIEAANAAVASCDAAAVAVLASVPTTTRGDDGRDACVVLPDRDDPRLRYYLGKSGLTGGAVGSADAEFRPGEGWTVNMDLTSSGSSEWDALAQQQFQRQVAIVLDSRVLSAPTIQPDDAVFTSFGGTAVISGGAGGFSQGDAEDLARLIDGGRLPVKLKTVNVADVSPTLGSDQLRAGIIAGVIGLALVALYMLVFYRLLGLVVIFGLVMSAMALYTIVTYLSSSAQLTLTLAGVTGIIVSAGVTVDSYIVYFERLKDEVRAGATVRSCADRAFHRSFRTILAADFVSLIGAIVLYLLAIGSVRGFAFFLGLSTVIDLVLSYFLMYPLVVLMSRQPRLVAMPNVGIAAGLDAPGVTA